MCTCICVFLEFNFSFDLGRQENSSSSFASWDEVYTWCVFSHMCAQLYILPESCERLAKVNLCVSSPFSLFLCLHEDALPPSSARSSFSLALCADDKMCPRGFETFSLRERTREHRRLPALQNAINATTKVLRAAPPLTISTSRPAKLLIKNTHHRSAAPRLANARAVREELLVRWKHKCSACSLEKWRMQSTCLFANHNIECVKTHNRVSNSGNWEPGRPWYFRFLTSYESLLNIWPLLILTTMMFRG